MRQSKIVSAGIYNTSKGNGDAQHSYFELNKTGRYSSQMELDHQLNDKEKLTIKNSVSYFDRSINLQGYRFSGVQVSTYSEANYASIIKS